MLEIAKLARCLAVIAQGRSARGNRLGQDVADGEMDIGFQIVPIDGKSWRGSPTTAPSAEKGFEDIAEVAAESAGLAATATSSAALTALGLSVHSQAEPR